MLAALSPLAQLAFRTKVAPKRKSAAGTMAQLEPSWTPEEAAKNWPSSGLSLSRSARRLLRLRLRLRLRLFLLLFLFLFLLLCSSSQQLVRAPLMIHGPTLEGRRLSGANLCRLYSARVAQMRPRAAGRRLQSETPEPLALPICRPLFWPCSSGGRTKTNFAHGQKETRLGRASEQGRRKKRRRGGGEKGEARERKRKRRHGRRNGNKEQSKQRIALRRRTNIPPAI